MKEIIKAHYTPFDISQKVWLEGTNLMLSYNKKIKTKREGPFKVLEKLTPVTYRLELLKKWKMFNTFHTALLMPYKENDVHGPNFPYPPPDLVEGQEEWEIERIIRHKKQRGCQGTWQSKYQVKWKGYEDMTWEPEENLKHTQDIIADYWNRPVLYSAPPIPQGLRGQSEWSQRTVLRVRGQSSDSPTSFKFSKKKINTG